MGAKGIDVEALSPRDINAQRPRATNDLKTKAAAQLKATKDKEHPPPPPPNVTEPPSSDRRDGAVYQVGRLLGKGGFAICYEGQLAGTRKRYALKIVKSKMPAKMEQKFQTELQIHSKMRQRNIVEFLRAFSFENSTYLVMEICTNGSLMDMVKRRKGVTEAEVRYYGVQIAGAIKYMHSKGIIHRDLKMGNIFLDKNMNAKIGDFGLAALVVTGRDMQTIRRTTLCGTPNYIAPEILEKGKKGHDHMVDIWSLGIIMFAMLTSKPPFQSSTTDEIYRRARERDYEWPLAEARYISDEAKDLVADMLEEADKRPDPDRIVEHPFFVSGYLPKQSDMSPRLREAPPSEDCFYEYTTDYRTQAQNLEALKQMCRECEVGPWSETKVVHKPVWKEVAAEEQAGLTPVIPLVEGIVYRPFEDWLRENQLQRNFAPQPSAKSADHTSHSMYKSDDLSSLSQKAPSGLLRAPPQSFAAQQRAQNRPMGALRGKQTMDNVAKPAGTLVRSRSKGQVPLTNPLSVESREQATRTITRSTRTQLPTSRTVPLPPPPAKKELPSRPRAYTPDSNDERLTLFSPVEFQERVPDSTPDVVLSRLQKLQGELERALNARSMAYISSREKTPVPPQIVVKWVDYTNKFGLGYILSDGSVGCILRTIPGSDSGRSGMLPPACMLVHGAERHIQRKDDPSYPDRHQIVPMTEGIYFYENNGEEGHIRVRVDPETFRVSVGYDGVPGKLSAGRDMYEHRKRERIVLWKKFANYMLAFGRELEVTAEENPINAPKLTDPTAAPSDVVTFYQRFGDVGCWVFCDGHLQFNFPDHTKIVLDATGTWCHFWHLPQDAAHKLSTTGSLEEASLDERTVLSYPLQTLLNFNVTSKSSTRRRPEIAPELQGIPTANDFRRKIEFVKNVVREWVANKGIGNSDMSREGRLRWTGARETKNVQIPSKHVWVTIGSRWGDERYSAYFDPRKPSELGPDIDENKKKSG